MDVHKEKLSSEYFSPDEIEMHKYIPIVLEQNRKKREEAKQQPTEEKQKKIILQPENTCDKGNEKCKCHIL
jgi:hypothetical protein